MRNLKKICDLIHKVDSLRDECRNCFLSSSDAPDYTGTIVPLQNKLEILREHLLGLEEELISILDEPGKEKEGDSF